MTRRGAWRWSALWLCACQPDPLCDPGQFALRAGCYDLPAADSGADAKAPDDSDAGACSGDRYEGFKVSCQSSDDCGCHAPACATAPLNYCTKLNCDPSSADDCPPGWTCLMIPLGTSPDPSVTHICFAP